MTLTRDNHHVPQWYQKLFLEPGETALAYLDTAPERCRLEDRPEIVGKVLFRSPPKRCFFQTDLYSTFFGTLVNDEIERSPHVTRRLWLGQKEVREPLREGIDLGLGDQTIINRALWWLGRVRDVVFLTDDTSGRRQCREVRASLSAVAAKMVAAGRDGRNSERDGSDLRQYTIAELGYPLLRKNW